MKKCNLYENLAQGRLKCGKEIQVVDPTWLGQDIDDDDMIGVP